MEYNQTCNRTIEGWLMYKRILKKGSPRTNLRSEDISLQMAACRGVKVRSHRMRSLRCCAASCGMLRHVAAKTTQHTARRRAASRGAATHQV